ncbi:Lysozyme M1 [bioreactor metagenome]|uniref:Lysozyme M1 n=1 Tax=bioreactor metagenome TaxID=1076179 RepID=A0A644YIA0_9ZZZZ
MVRRRKNGNRRWYIVLACFFLLIIFLVFTNPGRYLVSWIRYQSGLQKHPSEKITRIGIPLPENYEVFGIDVSRYQNQIDWVRVADFKSGRFTVEFVFIKATEGKSMRDPAFADNWDGAKEAGIPRGAYHYFKPGVDAETQANHFCRNVKLEKGDLPPVLDVEETADGMGRNKLVKSIWTWLQIVERHYGVKPIVYSGAVFFETYLSGTSIEKYPLWVAHYYESRPATFAKWKFWQFSDKASIDGISGPVDANVFSGGPEQLKALTVK